MYNTALYQAEIANGEPSLANLEELVNKAIENIYQGFEGVEPNLYEITSKILNKALDEGLTLKYNVKNASFIHELKTNIHVFSAFKSHNQAKDMAALLYDKEGKLIPESQWRKEALKISDHQNKTWLNTERNTALRRGRIASDFKKFEEKKHLYPNLRWLESTAGTPRTEHVVFYNVVRAVDDPFWLSNFPGDEWNCKCGIEQTKDDVTDVPVELPEPTPGLDNNPAFSGEIFTETHPQLSKTSKREKSLIKKDLQAILLKEGYSSTPDFKYANKSKIFIHPLADKNDLALNLFYAEFLAQRVPGLKIKIREHVYTNSVKNPEYELNGKIGELKSPKSWKNFDTAKNAIKQGCEFVVYALPDDYPYSSMRYAQEVSRVFKNSSRNKVTTLYIVKNMELTEFKV